MKRIFFLCFLLLLPFAAARSAHITALSVVDENSTVGGIADIFLEIKPGTGAVYIESFPLTKIDTQVSTRVAKEIACQRSRVDCSKFDFFYIINVRSSVIGGPSAGGATAVLTYALLEELPINNRTAMTGAIMSGGIIGPVGGVRAKVAGAAAADFERVLIPAWETNETTDVPLERIYDIDVVRIRNLDEAIFYFTGKQAPPPRNITPPQGYIQGMQRVSDTLCEHAAMLTSELEAGNETQGALDPLARGRNASRDGAHYTAASLCFSSALRAQSILLRNASNETRHTVFLQILREHTRLEDAIHKQQPSTIADLEIQLIVFERLSEVEEILQEMNMSSLDGNQLAYAYERLETAGAWYSMLGKVPSKNVDITQERLALSCRQKLDEAQERINYLAYIFPGYTAGLERSLKVAYDSAQREEHSLCLLQASQAKAEANALLTAVYVPENEFEGVVREKLATSYNQLARQADQDVFPILGYSYTEYSNQLLSREPYSAALYAEYSLELGNLEIYFPPRKDTLSVDKNMLLVFGMGIVLGALVTAFIMQLHRQSSKVKESHRPKKVAFARNLPGKKR